MIIKYIQYRLTLRMNRQNWTSQQDSQLREVVSKNGSQDWTRNAQLLREISSSAQQKKRTGKQCRQRWYNHLDPTVLKSQWQPQQQIRLFQMHKQCGNKWKQLTRYLPGRTDNDIKNHFYSTLRRSLRRLNKYMGQKNSTSQMREIKPSVLTFIINHIYGQEIKDQSSPNHHLINSLKQLPQLIFKFSSFKPVKQNMDKKIDQNLRDRITIIMGLVEQFKELYRKDKNQEMEPDVGHKKIAHKLEIKHTLSYIQGKQKNKHPKKKKQNIKHQQASEADEVELQQHHNSNDGHYNFDGQVKQQYGYSKQQSMEQEEEEEAEVQPHMSLENIWNSNSNGHTPKIHKQFIPIVTIQRKPSGFDQKPNPKKLILIPKTQQKLPQPSHDSLDAQQHKNHIRSLSIHQQQCPQHELMPIEQPSMSLNQNSQFFSDLIVIGKHIEPIECQATNQQNNYCEIDEILYQNYQS